MHIRNSLDWAYADTVLRTRINSRISSGMNKAQLHKMIDNIGTEVTSLSKAEVMARQGSRINAEHLLEKINADIDAVDEFILVAALIG